MAGLTAAWALSDPAAASEVESVTVYQRGWRLGGKGASSRGPRGRIEEHGLHVWLGYYENAFRLLRQVYEELDRPVTAPECPIACWRDALAPAGRVGVAEEADGRWSSWVATFSGGAGGGPQRLGPPARRRGHGRGPLPVPQRLRRPGPAGRDGRPGGRRDRGRGPGDGGPPRRAAVVAGCRAPGPAARGLGRARPPRPG